MQVIQSLISEIEILQLINIVFCIVLLRISLIDIRLRLIYNRYTGTLFFAGIIIHLMYAQYDAVIWGIICGAILWGIGALHGNGIGGGDIKLACAIGVWIGNAHCILTILIAFLCGGIVALIILLMYGNRAYKFQIPFAPFLTIGTIAVIIWGEYLWQWWII